MKYKVRPELVAIVNSNTSETEKFQNTVLRPIIKMQHDLLIAFFKNYLVNSKINFDVLTVEKKKLKIESIFKNDRTFKNKILGIILGCYTVEEYMLYNQKSSEFNKRILQIVIQRLQNSI